MQRLVLHVLVLVFALFVAAQLLMSWAPSDESGPASAAVPETGETGSFGGETVIERDASGQFHLAARVNGEDADFLIDTGADIVALAPAEAERLGLDLRPEDFGLSLRTASGEARAARVRLDRLELGDASFRDVDAVVVEGLGVNLLGQSLLRRLGRVELAGDRMVIEPR